CRIVTFEKVTQNFLGKTSFFLTALEIFAFLNRFLKTAFFLTALENCVFLNWFLKSSLFLTNTNTPQNPKHLKTTPNKPP
ncbi:MAG: hypothetical protein RSA94_02975, partial [Mucinivorans sp.]